MTGRTTPWLDATPLGISGTGSGGGGPVQQPDMPGWDWNITSPSTYTFDGTTVSGNPNVNLVLGNNQAIGFLDFSRDNSVGSFGPRAPVSEPSTWVVLAGGAASRLALDRRRHRNSSRPTLLAYTIPPWFPVH